MDSINKTARIMKEYALRLVNDIQNKGLAIVESQNYVSLLEDLHSAMGEYVPCTGRLNKDPEFIRGYIRQLLINVNFAVELNDPDFKHITIDLNNIMVI